MNGELREAFDDIKRENKEEHAKTRAALRDVETRLNVHLVESAVTRAQVQEHFESRKDWKRWLLTLAAALVGAGAALLTRFIR